MSEQHQRTIRDSPYAMSPMEFAPADKIMGWVGHGNNAIISTASYEIMPCEGDTIDISGAIVGDVPVVPPKLPDGYEWVIYEIKGGDLRATYRRVND